MASAQSEGAKAASEAAPPAAAELPKGPEGPEGLSGRLERRISTLVGKPWFWVALIALIAVLPLGRALGRDVPKPPAMKLSLPAFSLLNERGERYGSENLKGRIWVADFVFTSCPSVCPKLTKRMAEIQHRARNLGEAFHLVTFTVDPENDTPERLAAYARTYHAEPHKWTFLTGPLTDIEATVVKGFKQAMGKEETAPGSGLFSVFHGERLVLVDQEGMIRGFYEATDEGIGDLLRDVSVIANVR